MEQHCYLVSYDLCQPHCDYHELYNALHSFPVWGRLTESLWAVISEHSSSEIRNFLGRCIDSDDRLIVIQSGKSAAWTKVLANNEWVKENLIK